MEFFTIFIYAILTSLIIEFISKKNLSKVMMMSPIFLVVGSLILIDFFLLFASVSGKFTLSIQIVTFIVICLALANKIKIDYRLVGFTPIDFFIFKEAKSMAGALNKKAMGRHLIFTGFLFILLIIVSFLLKPVYLKGPVLYILIILNIIFFILLFMTAPRYNSRISVFKVGIIIYFISFINDPARIRPKRTTRKINDSKNVDIKKSDKPIILVIQSESFVDPYVLGSDKFNSDPIPFYHELIQKTYSFNMATRAFGGGTVQTEYEILTGLSTIFFPRDTTVFSKFLKYPIPSLGSILKTYSYKSLLIHPFHEWYYNRVAVYQALGFDRFLSISSFENHEAQYIKDKDVYDKVLSEIESGTDFIFSVTMQNHTPYENGDHNHDIKFSGSFKDDKTGDHFDNYLNGLKESDLALEYFIDKLKKLDREVLLLFYGDHLPIINQDPSFYQQSSWSEAEFDSKEFYYDLRKSPGFIWANKSVIEISHETIDATAILARLFQETRLAYPEYLKDLSHLYKSMNLNGLFRDFVVINEKIYDHKRSEFKDLYNKVKTINNSVFNDEINDKWCHVSDEYYVN